MKHLRRPGRLRFAVLGGLLAAAAGCGPDVASVRGKVTLDGQPVDGGTIAFLPAAEGVAADAPVRAGEYDVPADRNLRPGNYRVEVRWPKPTGKKVPSADPGFTIDQTREAVPAGYNTQSTLTAELGRGENVKDFALTSR